MRGCLKNILASVGCLVVLVAVGVGALLFQGPIRGAWHAFRGDLPSTLGVEDVDAGRPTARAARTARRKQAAMARFLGPDSVRLSASELAVLIVDGLDPLSRRALDSIAVTLEPDRLVFEALLVTDVWGREALGMFGGLLQPREPIRVAGRAWVGRPGVVVWQPDAMSIRGIPLPGLWIRRTVGAMTGRPDGAFRFAVPVTVRRLSIDPAAVTFYREGS